MKKKFFVTFSFCNPIFGSGRANTIIESSYTDLVICSEEWERIRKLVEEYLFKKFKTNTDFSIVILDYKLVAQETYLYHFSYVVNITENNIIVNEDDDSPENVKLGNIYGDDGIELPGKINSLEDKKYFKEHIIKKYKNKCINLTEDDIAILSFQSILF